MNMLKDSNDPSALPQVACNEYTSLLLAEGLLENLNRASAALLTRGGK